LIHPTVWPKYTNFTDWTEKKQDRTGQTDGQTDRQDNGPTAYRANRFTIGRPRTVA